MTYEEKYEIIKGRTADIMGAMQMAKAARQAGNEEAEFKYALKAYKDASILVKDYPDMEAAFVTYAGSGSSLFRLYDERELYKEALQLNMEILLKMRLLKNMLKKERPCVLLIGTMNDSTMCYLELCDKIHLFDKHPLEALEILALQYDILYALQNELKKTSPSNLIFMVVNRVLEVCEDKGATHNPSLSIDDLNGLINKLASKLEKIIDLL